MKHFYILLVLSLNLFAQAPPIDNTFNSSETGVYQQKIGRHGVLLPNSKILTSYSDGNLTSSKVLLLNTDGSLDNSFNSDATSIGSSDIMIYPKSDGKFITFTGAYNSTDVMKFRSFNADGTINTSFTEPVLGGPTTGMSLFVKKIIYQDDGKILIVGRFNLVNNLSYKNIVRLNNDGSIDTSFSVGSGFSDQVECIAIQSDGKYVVGGAFNSYRGTTRGRIARLNTDGTLDASFNMPRTLDGIGSVVNGFDAPVYDVEIQINGKIIVIGSILRSNYNIVSQQITRLNADGTRDTTFSYNYSTYSFRKAAIASDGKIVVSSPDSGTFVKRFNTNGTADNTFSYSNTAFFLYNDGEIFFQGTKIILIGDYQAANGITRFGAHRINTTGSLDLTFNPHAGPNVSDMLTMNIQTIKDDLKVKILLDQKILLAGSFTNYNDIPCRNICRLTQNGDFDNTFQLDPTVKIYTSDNDRNKLVLQQYDGKILLSFNDAEPLTYVNNVKKDIIRLNSNGSLDNTFNFSYSGCGFNDIKLMNDGKMLAVGGANIFINASNKYKVIRFNLDGTIDTGFNSMLLDQKPNSIDLQSDNKILITFTESNTSLPYKPVVRLNADGTLDTSFNINANGGKRTSYIKNLPNGKMLITYNLPNTFYNYSYIDRLNSDGTPDTTFNRYTNTKEFGYTYDHPTIKLLENGKILAFATDGSNPITNRSLLILSPDGILLNTFAQNISRDFDVQNCSNIILYGFFNKIGNANKNNIARYGSPIIGLTQTPSGEIYQSFSNGQTLADLLVTGTNIQWYDVPASCALNNNSTNRSQSNIESLLPYSTVLVSGTTYYASQTVNSIESNYRLPVTVINSTLGINDNTLVNLSLYPNPVENNLKITNSSIIDKVVIYSLVGQKILDTNLSENNFNIDFSNYSKGIYLIKIISENKSQTYKVIKK